jgi:integrase
MNNTEDDRQPHGGTAPPARRRRGWRRGSGGVRKRGAAFYIRYYAWDPEKRKRCRIEELTTAKSATEARDILNERLGDKAKGVMPAAVSKTRLGELFQDMRRDYENKKQRIDVIEGRWKHLEAFFGDERVKLITTDRVDRYVEVRRKKGAAEQTIGNEIAVLRRMLNLGVKRRKVAKGSLPEFPTIKAENVRAVFFDDDEFDRLLEALPEEIADTRDVGNDWLLPFVVLARWTGMRRNELLRLEWRSVDLKTGAVTLAPFTTKNKDPRTIYLPPEAYAALKMWDEHTRGLERERGVEAGRTIARVFHRRGDPIREFPYDVWHAACKRAKLGGRRILHDFRRSAARSYRRAGVSEGVIMQIGGWRTRSVFERYNIKNQRDLQEAASQVGQFRKEQLREQGQNQPEQGQTGTLSKR